MKKTIIAVTLMAAFITACSDCKNKNNTTAPQEIIISADSLTQNFINYWNKNDTTALSNVFATDAVVLLNNGNFVGHDTIYNYWIKEQTIKTKNLLTNKVLSETSCKIAYYAGSLKLDFVNNGKVLDSGEITYSLIWKKQNDNTWKIELLHLATIGDKPKNENKKEDKPKEPKRQ